MNEKPGVVRWAGVVVWILGFFAFVGGGAGVVPGIIAFTLVFGEQTTATVTGCGGGEGRRSLDCSGTWRTGSGHISGVGRSDVGEQVDVRVGPLGPYATPLYSYWQVYTVLPVAGWLTYLGVRRRLRGGRTECHDAAL